MNNLYFLENVGPTYEKGWFLTMGILIFILIVPWIFIIFRYWIFRKLRIRFILEDDLELKPIYLKNKSKIEIPYKEYTWYMDKELTVLYQDMLMPDYNIKLYGKKNK